MSCLPCFQSKNTDTQKELEEVPVARVKDHPELTPPAPVIKPNEENSEEVPNGSAKTYNFRELAVATKNFKQGLIGEGGFGKVYKATLSGQVVAVKQLDRNGTQGTKEFLVEVMALSLLRHPNLVSLIGYCADGDQRLLVYEYLPMGSLDVCLHDLSEDKKPLDWYTRMKIASDAAQGLEYLHEKANPPIIYRDLKTSNILLDQGFTPKLSDYGLAKLASGGNMMNMKPRVMGTYGFSAPEYERNGELTAKSDVYSFGVILLELITGRKALDTTRPTNEQNLVTWAQPMFKEQKRFPDLADPLLKREFPVRGLNQAVGIAAMCLQEEPSVRPLISDVVSILGFLAMPTPGEPLLSETPDPEPGPSQHEDHHNKEDSGHGKVADDHRERSNSESESSSESSESEDNEDDHQKGLEDSEKWEYEGGSRRSDNEEYHEVELTKSGHWGSGSMSKSRASSHWEYEAEGSSSSDGEDKDKDNRAKDKTEKWASSSRRKSERSSGADHENKPANSGGRDNQHDNKADISSKSAKSRSSSQHGSKKISDSNYDHKSVSSDDEEKENKQKNMTTKSAKWSSSSKRESKGGTNSQYDYSSTSSDDEDNKKNRTTTNSEKWDSNSMSKSKGRSDFEYEQKAASSNYEDQLKSKSRKSAKWASTSRSKSKSKSKARSSSARSGSISTSSTSSESEDGSNEHLGRVGSSFGNTSMSNGDQSWDRSLGSSTSKHQSHDRMISINSRSNSAVESNDGSFGLSSRQRSNNGSVHSYSRHSSSVSSDSSEDQSPYDHIELPNDDDERLS